MYTFGAISTTDLMTATVPTLSQTMNDYFRAVAKSDAKFAIISGMTPGDMLRGILATGWIPIYCSSSPGTMNKIKAALNSVGWSGKAWKNTVSKVDYYGWTLNLADAPAAYKNRSCASVEAYQEAIKFLTDAKSYGEKDGATLAELAATAAICVRTATAPTFFDPSSLLPTTTTTTTTQQTPDATAPVPIYKKWWFYVVAGVGLVVVGTGLYFLLRKKPAVSGLGYVGTRLNDHERELWVANDEGLYNMQQSSRLSMRTFIRQNRELIDDVIRGQLDPKPQRSDWPR